MRLPSSAAGALALLLLAAPAVLAQAETRPTATAVRTAAPMHIDARFTEPAWEQAPAITTFTQNEPVEGAPVSQRTVVRLAYDDHALYVGAWLYDSLPVQRRLARRDAWLPDSDWFGIALDSFNDRLTAYQFAVNPAGVRSDEVLSTNSGGDDSWDPVWEVETAVTDSGWVAELRIPFSQLRFGRTPVQTWGLQLTRVIARRQEEAVFAFTPQRERGGIARYGRLVGLRELDPGRGFELVPYVVSRAEYQQIERAPTVSFEDPYRDGSDFDFNAGLDLKYRLASNLTLDLTVNPDFGQVELDPAVINLSAFETRFQERRPFFVEGRDIFVFGGHTQPVYSRRIGGVSGVRAPGGTVYADVPESASILGAAKLTGRSRAGWVFGALGAVTDEEEARYTLEDGTRATRVVAPLTGYAVGRLERSLRDGETVIGVLGTAVHRRLAGTGLLETARSDAFTGGADVRHEWADRAWALSASLAGSRIAGEPAVLLAAQRSSARYYQRPDAGHLALDSSATNMGGYAADVSLEKEAGEHWRGDVTLRATSPGFEINDLGFQRDADRLSSSLELEYVQEQPGRVLREWNAEVGAHSNWNYGGDWLGGSVGVDGWAQLLNYWSGRAELRRGLGGYDDRLTRGGPIVRAQHSTTASLSVETDSRRNWVAEGGAWLSRTDEGGRGFGIELELELRPSAAWSISIGPEYSRETAVAQYVATVSDPYAAATFGRRYLFADLEQHELSLDTRLNLTVRPGLSLELFVRPLIASGAFGGVKELAAPRTFEFLRYGADAGTIERDGREFLIDPDAAGPAPSFRVDDEDFAERSLRGNAVLRWEWRPGSTLYFVWQQVRESEEWDDRLAVGRSVRELFRAPARNVFALKLSYWLAR